MSTSVIEHRGPVEEAHPVPCVPVSRAKQETWVVSKDRYGCEGQKTHAELSNAMITSTFLCLTNSGSNGMLLSVSPASTSVRLVRLAIGLDPVRQLTNGLGTMEMSTWFSDREPRIELIAWERIELVSFASSEKPALHPTSSGRGFNTDQKILEMCSRNALEEGRARSYRPAQIVEPDDALISTRRVRSTVFERSAEVSVG